MSLTRDTEQGGRYKRPPLRRTAAPNMSVVAVEMLWGRKEGNNEGRVAGRG